MCNSLKNRVYATLVVYILINTAMVVACASIVEMKQLIMIGSSNLRKLILSDHQKRKYLKQGLFHLLLLPILLQLWNGLLNIWSSDRPKMKFLRLRVQVCLSWQNCCVRCHRLCYTSQTGQSISLIPIRRICVKDARGLLTL